MEGGSGVKYAACSVRRTEEKLNIQYPTTLKNLGVKNVRLEVWTEIIMWPLLY